MKAYSDLEEILIRFLGEADSLTPNHFVKMKEESSQTIDTATGVKGEEYLQLMDSSFCGSFFKDMAKDEVYLSEPWKKRLGLEALSPQQMSFALINCVHPEDRDKIKKEVRRACAIQETIIRLKFRAKTVDAGYIWLLGQGKIIYNPEGRAIQYFGTHLDITDFKKTEEENRALLYMLAKEKDKLSALINCIPLEVWFFDKDRKLTLANSKTRQNFGLAKEEFFSSVQNTITIYQPDFSPRPAEEDPVIKLMQGIYVNGQEEIVRLPATNQLQYRKIYGSPVRDKEGNIMGGIMIVQDMTEQKRTEIALRKEEEKNAFLLNLVDTLRAIKDPQAVQETASNLLEEYLRNVRVHYAGIDDHNGEEFVALAAMASEKSIKGYQSLRQCFSDEDFQDMVASLRKGQVLVMNEPTLCTADPEEDVEDPKAQKAQRKSFVVVPLIREERLVWVLCVVSDTLRVWTRLEVKTIREVGERTWDIMERCHEEAALKQSEQRAMGLVEKMCQMDQNKNHFLNTLSHELRNPLASIMMTLSLVDCLKGESERIKATTVLKRQVDQLSGLADDLLDVTRITQNKLVLTKEIVLLNDIIKQVIADLEPRFIKKGVFLEALMAELVQVEADPRRLIQILNNLLENSLKFTPQGGRVFVSLTIDEPQQEAILMVSDTGRGIEKDIMNNLFEPFVQADNSLTRCEGGLGLGLAIVKGLVEMHGGCIIAASKGLGQGAQFVIRLPFSQAFPVDAALDQDSIRFPGCCRRILVIDDIRDIADALCSLLETLGHEARSATSGAEGVRLAEEFLPEIVICDLGLPDINGYDVVQFIKRHHMLKDTFCIALSGYAQPDDIQRSLEAGFNSHVAKPVDFNMLKNILLRIQ